MKVEKGLEEAFTDDSKKRKEKKKDAEVLTIIGRGFYLEVSM